MTPQERELIEGLFQRLKAADTPNKDREAEDLIAKRVAEQPAAPYLLVQTVLVQEHALNAAQARMAQLEKETEALKAHASAAPSGGSTSFLGGLLGGRWNQGGTAQPSATPARTSVPVTAPAGAAPAGPAAPMAGSPYAPAAAAPASGGFLHSALTTAAGVAGGALLADGLSSLLFHRPGPFAPYVGAGWGGGYGGSPWGGGGGNIYETNVYNYDGDRRDDQNAIDTSNTDPGYDPGGNDPNVRDASYDPSNDPGNYDDGSGGDFGGGDDFGGGNDDMSV